MCENLPMNNFLEHRSPVDECLTNLKMKNFRIQKFEEPLS